MMHIEWINSAKSKQLYCLHIRSMCAWPNVHQVPFQFTCLYYQNVVDRPHPILSVLPKHISFLPQPIITCHIEQRKISSIAIMPLLPISLGSQGSIVGPLLLQSSVLLLTLVDTICKYNIQYEFSFVCRWHMGKITILKFSLTALSRWRAGCLNDNQRS